VPAGLKKLSAYCTRYNQPSSPRAMSITFVKPSVRVMAEPGLPSDWKIEAEPGLKGKPGSWV
jgi:hypothetical protein